MSTEHNGKVLVLRPVVGKGSDFGAPGIPIIGTYDIRQAACSCGWKGVQRKGAEAKQKALSDFESHRVVSGVTHRMEQEFSSIREMLDAIKSGKHIEKPEAARVFRLGDEESDGSAPIVEG
jgi:hypothetical protein